MSPPDGDFGAAAPPGEAAERDPDERLTVDVDGFEGPLDMLLALARSQKVDLRRISVLQLAEQYLAFVEAARAGRIDLAAEYLVMAAWLAYLKSRLLLPAEPCEDGPSGEELAARLALRLERLDAMRRAAAALMARDRLGQDIFARGAPETVAVSRRVEWRASLSELLRAYARLAAREDYRPLQLARPEVWPIEAALSRLSRLVGQTPGWSVLAQHLPQDWLSRPERRRSALASAFAATLELARRGEVEIRQEGVFAPIHLQRRAPEAGA